MVNFLVCELNLNFFKKAIFEIKNMIEEIKYSIKDLKDKVEKMSHKAEQNDNVIKLRREKY